MVKTMLGSIKYIDLARAKSKESQTFVSRGPVKLMRAFKQKGAKSYGKSFCSILEDLGFYFR